MAEVTPKCSESMQQARRRSTNSIGSLDESREVDALCATLNVDLLIAIGGGRIIDTAKMVAFQRKVALLCIPVGPLSDGITSPVSVLADGSGRKRSLPSGIPACVVVDLSLTTKAPLHLTKAGVGDLISNASALLDAEDYEAAMSRYRQWLRQASILFGVPADQGPDRARYFNASRPRDDRQRIDPVRSFDGVFRELTALQWCRTSSPPRARRHERKYRPSWTEGRRCDPLLPRASKAARPRQRRPGAALHRSQSRPASPPGNLGVSKDQFIRAVELAPEMRPGRYTVLHQELDHDLMENAYDRAFV